MALQTRFEVLPADEIAAKAAEMKAGGWRFVQMHAVNTDNGVDLIYTYEKNADMVNYKVLGVKEGESVESVTPSFLPAFVFENEAHDLFGVDIAGIAIDFGGKFYALSQEKPMTVISPAQLAAREKAAKIAAAKAAKEAKEAADGQGGAASTEKDDIEAKLAGMDPEKAAKVRAAMEAKAKKEAAAKAAADEAALEEKLAGMDPEKAAKVRAAMEAKAKKAAAAAAKEGE